MIEKIKNYSSSKMNLLINFLYIGLLKLLNIGSKYILVGYLVRSLGENGYGLLTWVDSIVQYFILIINLGFDLYAAKYVVENKDNPSKLNEAISAIYYIKSALFLFCFILLIPISFNVQINEAINLIALMLLIGIGEVLTPIWYFQGIEKMKTITIVTFFSKLVLVGLTLLFVRQSSDLTLYILFLVVTGLIVGVFTFKMMIKESGFKFIQVSKDVIFQYIKDGYLFFIGKISMFAFNLGVLFAIGYLFSKSQVSGFDIASKIIFVFIIPYEVLQQALFPKVVRGLSRKKMQLIAIGTLVTSSAVTLVLYLFSDKVITIFGGGEMLKYAPVLNLLIILIPLISLTIIIGNCFLVAKGFYREYNFSLVASAILFVIMIIVLKMTNNLSFYNLIIVRVLADFILLTIRLYYNLKKKII